MAVVWKLVLFFCLGKSFGVGCDYVLEIPPLSLNGGIIDMSLLLLFHEAWNEQVISFWIVLGTLTLQCHKGSTTVLGDLPSYCGGRRFPSQ